MSYFTTQHLNFGTVKTGQPVTVDFFKVEDAPRIRSTNGACHCTSPTDLGDRVQTTYTGESLAQGIDTASISKRIIVNFENGIVENLLITGTLTR